MQAVHSKRCSSMLKWLSCIVACILMTFGGMCTICIPQTSVMCASHAHAGCMALQACLGRVMLQMDVVVGDSTGASGQENVEECAACYEV